MANEMISEDVALYNHKVDVYSFAIIMWELYFEENPYLNSQSQKFAKFLERKRKSETHYSSEGLGAGLNVLFQVLKGVRPLIPFNTEEEMKEWIREFMLDEKSSEESRLSKMCEMSLKYFELMQSCWNHDFHQRPEFSEICTKLSNILSL